MAADPEHFVAWGAPMIRYRCLHGGATCEVSLDVDNTFTTAPLIFDGDKPAVLALKRAMMSALGLSVAELRQADGKACGLWMRAPGWPRLRRS
ncbi:MAG: hypothetical protein U0263_22870 [Polyangiaceae bacterium]